MSKKIFLHNPKIYGNEYIYVKKCLDSGWITNGEYLAKFTNSVKNYTKAKGFNAEYWLVPDAGHVDSMLMYTEEYGNRMKTFFEKNLGN